MFGVLAVIPHFSSPAVGEFTDTTLCSKTHTVKVTKLSAIFLIIMKTVCCVGLLENRKLRNFSRHHALYHPDVLYSVQLKVKGRLSKIRA
jgi:hypothetical protein